MQEQHSRTFLCLPANCVGQAAPLSPAGQHRECCRRIKRCIVSAAVERSKACRRQANKPAEAQRWTRVATLEWKLLLHAHIASCIASYYA